MRINFHGKLSDEPVIRAGFIGCGSHAFRNVYPALQFAPVDLVATCDLDIERARAFAKKFGATNAYADYRDMLEKETLDAVFVVTNYDDKWFPRYANIAVDCLSAGVHVWIEKPPAVCCADVDRMKAAAAKAGKHVLVGMKKMFFPANEKAKELMELPEFGEPNLLTLQYPQFVPPVERILEYARGEKATFEALGFLDHLCHPMSLLVFLMGMPATFYYERTKSGAALATFTFECGAAASLALTHGAAYSTGMERTMIVSDRQRQIVVDNNIRVFYYQDPPPQPGCGYGSTTSSFAGSLPGQATAFWEPEFSLGQLYNKGLFLLGYYGEVEEFARSILENRAPAKGTLDQAWQVTRVFEAFGEGPGKIIPLASPGRS